MVKMLTALVSTISISQVFLLKKKMYFSKNISIYAIFNYQIFNDTLTNDIVSFEQLNDNYCLLMRSTVNVLKFRTPKF